MNPLLTLLLFNPLESIVILLPLFGWSMFKEKKFYPFFFIFGVINYFFQNGIETCIVDESLKLTLHTLYGLLIVSIILFYMLRFIEEKQKFILCLLSNLFNSAIIITVGNILYCLLGILTVHETNLHEEIMVNFVIKIVQFVIIFYYLRRKKKMKDLMKKAMMSADKEVYTMFTFYTPAKPEALKK